MKLIRVKDAITAVPEAPSPEARADAASGETLRGAISIARRSDRLSRAIEPESIPGGS